MKNSKNRTLAILYLMGAAVIWGAAGPIIKYTLYYIPPFTFLFLRFLAATIVILPFLMVEQKKHPVDKRDWINLIVICLLGGTIYLTMVFFGFKYTTSLDGTLISSSSTIVVLLASSKLLGEKITRNEKIGAAVGLFGTLLITIQPLLEGKNISEERTNLALFGNLLMLGAIASWTAYTIWSKKMFDHKVSRFGNLLHYFHLRSSSRKYSPLFLTGLLCLVSLITFAPLSFMEISYIQGVKTPTTASVVEGVKDTYTLPKVSADWIAPIFGVLYMGIASTLIAYGMYEWAIKEIPVAETAIYSYLSPVFAIPFSYLLLDEKISFVFVLGGLIIGYGVYLSEKK